MSTISSPVELEEEVIFYDTDCGGVVHNLAYLRMVEKARTHLFRDRLNLGPEQMQEENRFPAVTRTEVDYLKPAKLGDQLRITAWIDSIEKMRVNCAFEISVSKQPEIKLIRCRQITVMVQMPSGRPCRIPAEWLKQINADKNST